MRVESVGAALAMNLVQLSSLEQEPPAATRVTAAISNPPLTTSASVAPAHLL